VQFFLKRVAIYPGESINNLSITLYFYGVFYYQILYTANTEHVHIEIVIKDLRVSYPEE
jgi:hypothetical protein